MTSFLPTGMLAAAGTAGIRRALDGAPAGTRAPRLICVFGVSFALAAMFTADPRAGFPAGAGLGLLWLTAVTARLMTTLLAAQKWHHPPENRGRNQDTNRDHYR